MISQDKAQPLIDAVPYPVANKPAFLKYTKAKDTNCKVVTDLKKDIHHNFSQVSNLASMLEGVESTTESVSQHKYSRLAQSSYDYFNSKGNADLVNTNLKNPKYSHKQ